jgi:hypothetical protein
MTAAKEVATHINDARELDRLLTSLERAAFIARNPQSISALARQIQFGEHGIPFEQLEAAQKVMRRLAGCDPEAVFEVRGDDVRVPTLAQRLETVRALCEPFRKLRGLLVA